jgi:diphthamide synthase (EF-2-diphthine--ammonia ligase)
VRQYREQRLAAAGWEGLFPLWGRSTATLAKVFVERGYAARLVCVDMTKLAAGFAGRAFDAVLLSELPEGVDPCGENGEFHTFASYGPGFAAPVEYELGEVVVRDERFAYCDLLGSRAAEGRRGDGVVGEQRAR